MIKENQTIIKNSTERLLNYFNAILIKIKNRMTNKYLRTYI